MILSTYPYTRILTFFHFSSFQSNSQTHSHNIYFKARVLHFLLLSTDLSQELSNLQLDPIIVLLQQRAGVLKNYNF